MPGSDIQPTEVREAAWPCQRPGWPSRPRIVLYWRLGCAGMCGPYVSGGLLFLYAVYVYIYIYIYEVSLDFCSRFVNLMCCQLNRLTLQKGFNYFLEKVKFFESH